MNATGDKGKKFSKTEDETENSMLNDIELSIDDDDDVGEEISELLELQTKHFQNNYHLIRLIIRSHPTNIQNLRLGICATCQQRDVEANAKTNIHKEKRFNVDECSNGGNESFVRNFAGRWQFTEKQTPWQQLLQWITELQYESIQRKAQRTS